MVLCKCSAAVPTHCWVQDNSLWLLLELVNFTSTRGDHRTQELSFCSIVQTAAGQHAPNIDCYPWPQLWRHVASFIPSHIVWRHWAFIESFLIVTIWTVVVVVLKPFVIWYKPNTESHWWMYESTSCRNCYSPPSSCYNTSEVWSE